MPRPRGSRRSAFVKSATFAGDQRDAVGPPSALLPTATAFAEQVEASLKAAEAELERIKKDWAQWTPEQTARLNERCSADALRAANAELRDNQLVQPDIRNWTESRWYPNKDDADHEDRLEEANADAAGNKRDRGIRIATPELGEDVQLIGDDEMQRAAQEAGASRLNLLQPPQVAAYLRKLRTADVNALLAMRATEDDDPLPSFPPPDDPQARILYTLTFHLVPHGPGVHHVPQQKLVCLGTTTLTEIRDNLLVGGDNIPVEETDNEGCAADEAGDDESNSSGPDEGDEDGFGYRGPVRRPSEEYFGGGETKTAGPRIPKWKNERRTTGAAFIVEDWIYADTREGMQDYASTLLETVEKTKWPGDTGGEQQENAARDHTLTPLDVLPSAASISRAGQEAPATSSEPLRPHRGKPNLRRGKAAQYVTLGEMPLRVGQPYLFLHQGDDEHIWSLDEVRALHPSDPSPWPPAGAHKRSQAYQQFRHPYPITTYLSRQANMTLSNARCPLCEREAPDLALFDDALTGETPSHVCRACFGTLHPVKRDWEAEARAAAVKKAPGRPKKLPTPPPVGYEDVADDEREHMDGVRTVPILFER